MNSKSEVVNRLAKRHYTKTAACVLIKDLFNVISEIVTDGGEVHIPRFGTFYVCDMPDRETLDINTHERVVVPGHKIPKFRPSETFKKAVKEGIYRT